MSTDRAYVVVLGWPEGTTVDSGAETLVHALGMDPWNAKQRFKEPPYVPGFVGGSTVGSVSKVLRERGVKHVIAAGAMLDGAPEAHAAKRFSFTDATAESMCFVEGWGETRGGDTGFCCKDVFALVRARVLKAKESSVTKVNRNTGLALVSPLAAMIGPGTTTTRAGNAKLVDVIDVWIAPGGGGDSKFASCQRVRVMGDKFDWDGVRVDKLASDSVNADLLWGVLARQCPKTVLDTNFETFVKGSREVLGAGWQSGASGDKRTKSRDTSPAFDLYSSVMGMVHHHQWLKATR